MTLLNDYGMPAICERGRCLAPAVKRLWLPDLYGKRRMQFRCAHCWNELMDRRIQENRTLRDEMRNTPLRKDSTHEDNTGPR